MESSDEFRMYCMKVGMQLLVTLVARRKACIFLSVSGQHVLRQDASVQVELNVGDDLLSARSLFAMPLPFLL